LSIEVSLHLHGTPYGELGWGHAAPANVSADTIRAYGARLGERLGAIADLMDRLYGDGWASQANSFDLAFTKAGVDTEEDARQALQRLGIPLDRGLLEIQEAPQMGDESVETYRFRKLLTALHEGEGSAREGEFVVPGVFAPEMVGMETLMPATRATVAEHPAGVTARDLAAKSWQRAHVGQDEPELDAGYVDVVYEFLTSVEDIDAGTQVAFVEHEHHAGCSHDHHHHDHEHHHH
jgi:hypothetical protein